MQNIIHFFTFSISLATACGVFIHDGGIDRATNNTLRASASNHSVVKSHSKAQAVDAGVTTDPHTHPEHAGRTLLKGFSYKNPSTTPREKTSKRYMLQNASPRGRHAFDNHHLPLLA